MKKIIMFKGEIETVGYFSEQMKNKFERIGHEVYIFDYQNVTKSVNKLMKFIEIDNTVVISFNFHGISGQEIFMDDNGIFMWEELNIPFYNIVVDHPIYYYSFLKERPSTYYNISIDRYHEKFMERFFPEVKRAPFLPLAGTSLYPDKNYKKIKDRRYDVTFTGNFAPYEICEKYITQKGEEYEEFYRGIIDDMLCNPQICVELMIEKHIKNDIPDATMDDIKSVMGKMSFIDLYVRYYTREQVIKTLADSGIKIHVFGKGWDKLKCKHPENIIDGDRCTSRECLEKISDSKISLNIMPWFKDGAHDRIFNTMLNAAVSLTDSSEYLDSILKDNVNSKIFNIQRIDEIPDMIGELLDNNDKMQNIADNGFDMAIKSHTWGDRARQLEKNIFS